MNEYDVYANGRIPLQIIWMKESFIHTVGIYLQMIRWSVSFEWRNGVSSAWMNDLYAIERIHLHTRHLVE